MKMMMVLITVKW